MPAGSQIGFMGIMRRYFDINRGRGECVGATRLRAIGSPGRAQRQGRHQPASLRDTDDSRVAPVIGAQAR